MARKSRCPDPELPVSCSSCLPRPLCNPGPTSSVLQEVLCQSCCVWLLPRGHAHHRLHRQVAMDVAVRSRKLMLVTGALIHPWDRTSKRMLMRQDVIVTSDRPDVLSSCGRPPSQSCRDATEPLRGRAPIRSSQQVIRRGCTRDPDRPANVQTLRGEPCRRRAQGASGHQR